jgi:hypothetical protein
VRSAIAAADTMDGSLPAAWEEMAA